MIRRLLMGLGLLVALLLAGLALLRLGLEPPAPLAPAARDAVLSDVTLLVPGEPRRPARRVEIRDGRIAVIGPARPDEADPYRGAYLMPGLVDAHVHWPPEALPGQTEIFAFLHLYHGVTTVRSLADTAEGASLRARDGERAGAFAGPRVLGCGRFLDGDPPLWRSALVVRNAREAEAAVARVAEDGFDCVKVYDGLDEASLAAIRDAARARGLPVVGHVPVRVPFERARLDDAQHLRGVHPPPADPDAPYPGFLSGWLRLDEARLELVTTASREAGTRHTPTLVTIDRLIGSRDYERMAAEPAYGLLPPWYAGAFWHARDGLNAARRMQPADFEMVEQAFPRMLEAVGHLHAAGIPIQTGTDTMAPGVVPGAALHRELGLLVEAGLAPEEALAASTREAAGFAAAGVPGLGTIAVGAPADLIVLGADPTRDLAALVAIEAVIRDGRLYDRARLDAQLERYRAWYRGVANRFVTGAMRFAFGRLLPLFFGGAAETGSD